MRHMSRRLATPAPTPMAMLSWMLSLRFVDSLDEMLAKANNVETAAVAAERLVEEPQEAALQTARGQGKQ